MTTDTNTIHLAGTFTVDSWDQQDESLPDGVQLGRARVTKTFSGDLVGTSTASLLLIGTASGTRSYLGFEQVTGAIAERTGSFLLRHTAEADAIGSWLTLHVVPGSGTGDLTAIHGTGQIDKLDDGSHHYRLDLHLD